MHQKSHVAWPGIEHEPAWLEAGDCLSHGTCLQHVAVYWWCPTNVWTRVLW